MIENTTWISPLSDLISMSLFILLIGLTLVIEAGFIYAFAKRKGYNAKGELLLIVVASNFVTGLAGFAISVVLML